MGRIGAEGRAVPRTREQWRARMREALRYEGRIREPLAEGAELVHRVVVIVFVSLSLALLVALAFSPVMAVFGRTVGSLANRFNGPLAAAELPPIEQRSVVVDRHGEVLATLAGEENRVFAPLARVPMVTQRAVLAIEDSKFYQHHGVDLAGLLRALVFNLRSGGHQGGSTITQQLVKNTIVGNERSLDRKIREARLAVALEKKLSKHQILEAYLNQVYLGNGVYGIGTAAEYYFGEPVEKLSLTQSALLAGMIKAPENYEPIGNPKEALSRRALVLGRMVDIGAITPGQAATAGRAPLGAKAHPLPASKTPYFVELIKKQIEADPRFGATELERAHALFQAGLRIETTLDLGLERAAQKAINGVLDKKNDPSAALVSIDAATGAVRAVVSGRSFDTEHYDLAVQGKRQPGSTFKPFTLLAALQAGMAPSLTFDTPSPLVIPKGDNGADYIVNNYDKQARGYIDMRTATEQSVNTYYIQLIQRVGPANVVAMAKTMGITDDVGANLSLALGTSVVSPYELASAYSTLANGGIHCAPYTITKITDANGKVIEVNVPSCERAISGVLAAQATGILRGVIERGTGRTNARIGRPAAGKTGTTDSYTDAWFAGYTPQIATVVWMGFPKDALHPLVGIHGLKKVVGGSLPAMMWARYMKAALRGVPSVDFPAPAGFAAVPLPDVKGMAIADAKATLDAAGFPTVKVVGVDSKAAPGTVLSEDPPGGGSVPGGTLITLEVSGVTANGSPSPSGSPAPSPSATPPKKKGH